ncbi:MAG: flippase-like domain-containing protein [Campylobacteraceae bacterium]|nr:flippase-like domain-containing protein [Campylobacteraceae bacterium]
MNRIVQIFILIIMLVYLFYGVDISKIDVSIFSLFSLSMTFLSILLAQIVLSLRWMNMSKLSFGVSLETIIVSSALNMLLPARLGEISKAFYLKKFYHYSYHKTISIIFIERFFDIVVLFLLICLWAYGYFINEIIKYSIIILASVIFVIIFLFNSKKILCFLKKIPFQLFRIYTQKIYKNINRLLKAPYLIFFYTILLWFFYLLSYIFFFKYSVNFHLTFGYILELFIFSTVALSIPLTPAGIGTFEGVIVLFLGHHGIDKADALVSATLYHVLIFVIDFAFLYIFLVFKNIKFKELLKNEN